MNATGDQIAEAVVGAIRDALIDGHTIEVPELGVFSVRHVASKVERTDDDSSVMIPPRDVVEFESRMD